MKIYLYHLILVPTISRIFAVDYQGMHVVMTQKSIHMTVLETFKTISCINGAQRVEITCFPKMEMKKQSKSCPGRKEWVYSELRGRRNYFWLEGWKG